MINFKLKPLNNILPFGLEGSPTLSWFGLTDGDLWLDFGHAKVYEYTQEALQSFEEKETPYNDYYITRFIEDFIEIFAQISEPIPDTFYQIASNFESLDNFLSQARQWEEQDDEADNDFYFEKYDKLISWLYSRSFDSGHLIGGPILYFFRKDEQITILWKADYQINENMPMWTSPYGQYELSYTEFKNHIKQFGDAFFDAMDKQVQLAVDKDWGNIQVDKKRLVEEHQERRTTFDKALKELDQSLQDKTDWHEIEALMKEMNNFYQY